MIKEKIRKFFRRKLRKLGHRLPALDYFNPLEALIYKNHSPNFFFVQIGANDGRRFDPIHQYVTSLNWTGIAIEPIKEYFSELKETYKDHPHVQLLNCAIYEENKKIKLFKAKPTATDPLEWKGVASLSRGHHKKSHIPSTSIEEEEVQGITFDDLLNTYTISEIDLLQIDTEGYDFNIIKMIDFDRMKPKIIHFEHGLRDEVMTLDQFLELNRILIQKGYKIIMQPYDCIAYL